MSFLFNCSWCQAILTANIQTGIFVCLAWCVFISHSVSLGLGWCGSTQMFTFLQSHWLWPNSTRSWCFFTPLKCFDYFSLGNVTCRAFNLSRCIQIFCYSPIWSPAAPVSLLHCPALLLVARTAGQDVSGERAVGGGQVSQVVPRVHGLRDGWWWGVFIRSAWIGIYNSEASAHLFCLPVFSFMDLFTLQQIFHEKQAVAPTGPVQ